MIKNNIKLLVIILILSYLTVPVFCGEVKTGTDNDITVYGYFKLDMAYDDSRVDAGNFAKWTLSEANIVDDNQFSVTANQSRFGLKFAGADRDGAMASGKLEVDFYGGGSENKANIMMRHAFMKVAWPAKNFSILAGQTSDVMSPLVPGTVNYSVAWWAGNYGYRRPQLRFTKDFPAGESKLQVAAAFARTIGDDDANGLADSGQDAGYPGDMQARVGYESKKVSVGVSGHTGNEQYDIDASGNFVDYNTSSVNLDVKLALSSKLVFKAEAWSGLNMDAYLGGIGQGINTTLARGIAATGGWASLKLGPFGSRCFELGASTDDPDDNDLNNGARSLNTMVFGNVWYKINGDVKAGLEISTWNTAYKNAASGEAMRVQGSMVYSF